MQDVVSLSRSVSGSSLQQSVHDEPTRPGALFDLVAEPRTPRKRVAKSTRRSDYLYLMYECRAMERFNRMGAEVVATQSRLVARAPIAAPLNDSQGIRDQMLTATHQLTMFVHARPGTYLFVEELQAFMPSEEDIY